MGRTHVWQPPLEKICSSERILYNNNNISTKFDIRGKISCLTFFRSYRIVLNVTHFRSFLQACFCRLSAWDAFSLNGLQIRLAVGLLFCGRSGPLLIYWFHPTSAEYLSASTALIGVALGPSGGWRTRYCSKSANCYGSVSVCAHTSVYSCRISNVRGCLSSGFSDADNSCLC